MPTLCILQIISVVVNSLAAVFTKLYKDSAIVSIIIKAVPSKRGTYSQNTPQTIDTGVTLQLTQNGTVAWFIPFDAHFTVKATEYAMGSIAGNKEANSEWNVRCCALQNNCLWSSQMMPLLPESDTRRKSQREKKRDEGKLWNKERLM